MSEAMTTSNEEALELIAISLPTIYLVKEFMHRFEEGRIRFEFPPDDTPGEDGKVGIVVHLDGEV